MSEAGKNSTQLQAEARKKLEATGWIVRKTIQFSTSGWTDMEFLKRPLQMFFCEIKSGKDTVSAIQKWRIAQLKYAGFPVFVCRNSIEIDLMVQSVNENWQNIVFPELTPEEKVMIGKPEPIPVEK